MPSGQSQIIGHVVASSGAPITNATVRLLGTAVTLPLPSGGAFELPVLPTNPTNPPSFPIEATAPGFGTFLMQNVPLYDRQRIILQLELPPAGQTLVDPGFPTEDTLRQRSALRARLQTQRPAVSRAPSPTAARQRQSRARAPSGPKRCHRPTCASESTTLRAATVRARPFPPSQTSASGST